jgi:flagellar assembly factor FliW
MGTWISNTPEALTITFPWGLPGFGQLRKFAIVRIPDTKPGTWLRSLEEPSIALPVIEPWSHFPEYEPVLPRYAVTTLEIESPGDVSIYCIVAPADPAHGPTVNLYAPVVINRSTRLGRQVMLDDARYAVRTPFPGLRQEAHSP